MAPQSWATKEEQDFLRLNLPDYEACQVKRKYKPFWQRLNRDYFAKFPVVDKLFPGLAVSQLDEVQRTQLSAAIVKQQKVCRIPSTYSSKLRPHIAPQGMVPLADESA